MGRDRLPDLLKYKSNLNMGEDEVIIINLDFTPRELQRMRNIEDSLQQYSDIRLKLKQLESNLDEMIRMTQQTNLPHFNENELDTLRNKNLSLGQKLMTTFNTLKINLPDDKNFTLESRIKRGLFYGLQKYYNIIWHKNENFLTNYETKLKKQLLHNAKIISWNITEEEVEDLLATNNTNIFVDNILLDTENERRKLKDLMDRHSELIKLEKSIQDVHALFIRIQNLVAEQSDLINVIERNATQASEDVKSGEEKLDDARQIQRKVVKKKIWLYAFGVVLLIIVLLFIFL
ncbi:syntaxin-4 [Condylostylus longicornis]|uniref:syntaxin-4 n=1 Tax=Condylostylus longicornis TaxID=2530218 RepID=UPI00244DA611|nr:syntaxin-4 [Condylostylus longicornis]XP_055385397.1 syntaxin-4 [Condylostylus longicornis]